MLQKIGMAMNWPPRGRGSKPQILVGIEAIVEQRKLKITSVFSLLSSAIDS
jgi:hypothetical protein